MRLFLSNPWDHSRENQAPLPPPPPPPHAAFRGAAWGGAVMGWEQLPVLCIHLTPTTFQQLSLPIRIVAHVIIVILFSKTSPLSVSLPLVAAGVTSCTSHCRSQGEMPQTREGVNQLHLPPQIGERRGQPRPPPATGSTWVRQIAVSSNNDRRTLCLSLLEETTANIATLPRHALLTLVEYYKGESAVVARDPRPRSGAQRSPAAPERLMFAQLDFHNKARAPWRPCQNVDFSASPCPV